MTNDLIAPGTFSLSRINRQIARQLRVVDQTALIKARKIEGVAFVAFVALNHTAWISDLERRLVHQVPHAEPRLMAIGDAFTSLAAAEIMGLNWK